MGANIRFLLNGEPQSVNPLSPTETVLDFLRERRGLKGTKEGCSEGDCGACSVVLEEAHEGGLRYRAVNACIQFLPTLHGKSLITVEGLADPDGELHPVQEAMVNCHGSQCGFCTPGFVMTLFALYQQNREQAPSPRNIEIALAGNLCRCTGYVPILRAGRQSIQSGREDKFNQRQPETLERLAKLGAATETDPELAGNEGGFHAPVALDELWQLVARYPDATLVAGATDVGLWVTKQLRDLPRVIQTLEVTELQQIRFLPDQAVLSIGAAVTYSDAQAEMADLFPEFLPVLERLGGWQVRNVGTIGGNIANGSPIGDMPPGLIALGTRLVLSSAQMRREIPLEDFFITYGQQDLRPGEVVECVLIPVLLPGQVFRTYKLSKRFDQDISSVCAAFSVQIEDGIVASARVCFGGMAGTPARASECEARLTGSEWNENTINSAMNALALDYSPIDDMRASGAYRMSAARNLLNRFYLETQSFEQDSTISERYGQADD